MRGEARSNTSHDRLFQLKFALRADSLHRAVPDGGHFEPDCTKLHGEEGYDGRASKFFTPEK
jgi:hypothetical protein